MERILLEIVTPKGIAVKEEVEEVVAPGLEGEFGVLPDHAFMMASLQMGRLTYRKGDRCYHLFVSGGYTEVDPARVVVLAEEVLRPGEIDPGEVERGRREAEERLKGLKPEDDGYLKALETLKRFEILGEVMRAE